MFTPDLHHPAFHVVLVIVGTVLGLGMLLAAVRLLRGPSVPDRVVALDMMGYFAIGIISVYSIAVNRPVLLSVAIVMGLILFLGTAAFALYIERRARP